MSRTRPTRSAPSRLAPTTLGAGLAMLALCLYFGASAGRTLWHAVGGAIGDSAGEHRLTLLGLDSETGPIVLVLTGGTIAVLVVLYLVAALGLLARRGWASDAALLVTLVFALFAGAVSVGGLTASPLARNAWEGLVVAVVNAGAFVAVLSRRSAAAVSAAEAAAGRERHGR